MRIDGVAINAVGAMPTDRGYLGNQMLRAALEFEPHLIQGVEMDDADISRLLPEKHWAVRHQGGAFRDGVMVAVRRDRLSAGRGAWLPGAPASKVNDPRPILRVPIWHKGKPRDRIRVGVFHRPRRNGGEAAAERMDERARKAGLDQHYVDHNAGVRQVQRTWPGWAVRGEEVVYVSAGPRVLLSHYRSFNVLKVTASDDHPGLRFSLSW